MFNNTGFSMPVVPAGGGGLFGGGNGGGDFWGVIVLLLLFGAFNGNGFGFGGFGGGNGGYSEIQRGFDNQAVITKLDGITYGLSDSTYALNNAISGGFRDISAQLAECLNNFLNAIRKLFAKNVNAVGTYA